MVVSKVVVVASNVAVDLVVEDCVIYFVLVANAVFFDVFVVLLVPKLVFVSKIVFMVVSNTVLYTVLVANTVEVDKAVWVKITDSLLVRVSNEVVLFVPVLNTVFVKNIVSTEVKVAVIFVSVEIEVSVFLATGKEYSVLKLVLYFVSYAVDVDEAIDVKNLVWIPVSTYVTVLYCVS